jgi:hypothetical protein
MRSGIPPWHMWGNTQQLKAIIGSGGNPGVTPGQLLRINYARPDSWHFLLSAKLLTGPEADITHAVAIGVQFDLTVGIGRSAIVIDNSSSQGDGGFSAWHTFNFRYGGGGLGTPFNFPSNIHLWTTRILSPNSNYSQNAPYPNNAGFPVAGADVTGPGYIDQIVAQDIQLSCRLLAGVNPVSAAIDQEVTVEVSAQFAPIVHHRPEWHKGGRFPGAEDGGGEANTVAEQMKKLGEEKAPPGSDADPREQGGIRDEQAEWQAYVDSLSEEQYQALLREQYTEEITVRSADPPVHRLRHNRHNPRRLG